MTICTPKMAWEIMAEIRKAEIYEDALFDEYMKLDRPKKKEWVRVIEGAEPHLCDIVDLEDWDKWRAEQMKEAVKYVDAELNKADEALDKWMAAQRRSDEAASKHKHQTAAQVALLSKDGGVTKAKESVHSTDDWFKRELWCNQAALDAQQAKMQYEQAIRRWETARSEFSAGRRVK